MRGKYVKPSELLELQRQTGKSYWDLIGRPLYDDGKDVNGESTEEDEQKKVDLMNAIDYALSLSFDQPKYDKGKDLYIDQNAGLSYEGYYDFPTGDIRMDVQKLPKYKKGKDYYTGVDDFISHFEGFNSTVYQKPGDVPTVGFGNTEQKWIDLANKNGGLTLQQAQQALREHIDKNVNPVLEKRIPGYNKMPHSAKMILQDILYNVGENGLFNKSPNFIKALNRKDWYGASLQMDWDNNKPGYEKGARDRNSERARIWNAAFGIKVPKTNENGITDYIARPVSTKYNVKQFKQPEQYVGPNRVQRPDYRLSMEDAAYNQNVPKYINKDAGVATWPRQSVLPPFEYMYNLLANNHGFTNKTISKAKRLQTP